MLSNSNYIDSLEGARCVNNKAVDNNTETVRFGKWGTFLYGESQKSDQPLTAFAIVL